jgi:hemoglobin-like flavoprotein
MTQQAELLRDTLERVLAADDTFPARFYELLFAAHPEVQPMFRSHSPGAQRKMFAQKLVAIVDHFADSQWVEREAAALGSSHEGYGVTPEMYEWVGDALIATLAEACGPHWSAEADRAWRNAYAQLTSAILRATADAEKPEGRSGA